MIELRNISKSYKTKKNEQLVLDDISLNIEKGSVVAIMGPSGSGKTTLINIIGMLSKPDRGEYILKKQKVDFTNLFALSKHRGHEIGYIVQNFALINDLKVKDNLKLALKGKSDNDKFIQKLEQVDLDSSFLNKYPLEMSGGQQQRVAIARSLLLEPEILIADEPTGALDAKTSKKILEIFLKLKAESKTTIIVTHDIEVAKYCDKTFYVKDGKIIDEKIEKSMLDKKVVETNQIENSSSKQEIKINENNAHFQKITIFITSMLMLSLGLMKYKTKKTKLDNSKLK